jgi:hypothetical protein
MSDDVRVWQRCGEKESPDSAGGSALKSHLAGSGKTEHAYSLPLSNSTSGYVFRESLTLLPKEVCIRRLTETLIVKN